MEKRRSTWRPIETMHLRPSIDLATLAQNQYRNMPAFLRFLLNILGAKNHSGDLLSYLLFERGFTSELIQLGFDDTLAREKEYFSLFFFKRPPHPHFGHLSPLAGRREKRRFETVLGA